MNPTDETVLTEAKPADPGPNALPDAVSESIDRVTSEFSAKAGAESAAGPGPKVRKGGWRSGKKIGRPRKIQVAGLDDDSASTLRADPLLSGVPSPGTPPPAAAPAIDPETIRALVRGIVGLMDEFAEGLCERIAFQKTGDETFAAAARKKAVMSEGTRELLTLGGIGVAKKYAFNLLYVEETMLAIGVSVWALALTQQVKALRKLPDPPKSSEASQKAA